MYADARGKLKIGVLPSLLKRQIRQDAIVTIIENRYVKCEELL